MPFRTALAYLLCACLLLPAHVGMAQVNGTAQDIAAASTPPARDCHGSTSSHRDRVALPDPDDRPDGSDPMPQGCCHQCDCGCPPTIALTATPRAAAVSTPTILPGGRLVAWSASGNDTPLRPPIA